MSTLTHKDYITILKFYNINPQQTKSVKKKAENILATKLCRCIKKVTVKTNDASEKKAIGICKNSVLKKKNLKSSSFKCKPRPQFLAKKKTKKLTKIRTRSLRKNKKRSYKK
jgi:hypothetical protein